MLLQLIVGAIVPVLVLGYTVIPCKFQKLSWLIYLRRNHKIYQFSQAQTICQSMLHQLILLFKDVHRHLATLLAEQVSATYYDSLLVMIKQTFSERKLPKEHFIENFPKIDKIVVRQERVLMLKSDIFYFFFLQRWTRMKWGWPLTQLYSVCKDKVSVLKTWQCCVLFSTRHQISSEY